MEMGYRDLAEHYTLLFPLNDRQRGFFEHLLHDRPAASVVDVGSSCAASATPGSPASGSSGTTTAARSPGPRRRASSSASGARPDEPGARRKVCDPVIIATFDD